ncbi:hypothetical protein F4804DRAFT_307794 [Jackrogersella minutella]|nr:hypothetical protein F4804DRAFT_307794 [Jackrogersella minutella]
MERDSRRARCQWRGCHTYNNIVCDGDQTGNRNQKKKRHGGLKTGQTYYYYYELDGSTETYDPSMPTTNACPYLPGQTVNTLEIPQERLSRIRSASMNSLRITDYKTMEPMDRFMTPRPAPPVPSLPDLRIGSSPVPAMSLVHKRSARSLSPAPSWTGAARRFLGRKKSFYPDSDTGSETEVESHYGEESKHLDAPRSTTSSWRSIPSREMTPESLRRFLSDDLPQTPPVAEQPPRLLIPDEIVEENEDDDNFATSAASETAPFTMLSPPPFQRSVSSASAKVSVKDNRPTGTMVTVDAARDDGTISNPIQALPRMATIGLDVPRSHFSYSTTSSTLVSPVSSRSVESRDLNQYSFFDDSDDDDENEDVFPAENESFPIQGTGRGNEVNRIIPKHLNSPITGYSLPQPATHNEKHLDATRIPTASLGSPELVTRLDSGVSLSNTNLLGRPGLDPGLEDLVNDMGWMADAIQPNFI